MSRPKFISFGNLLSCFWSLGKWANYKSTCVCFYFVVSPSTYIVHHTKQCRTLFAHSPSLHKQPTECAITENDDNGDNAYFLKIDYDWHLFFFFIIIIIFFGIKWPLYWRLTPEYGQNPGANFINVDF